MEKQKQRTAVLFVASSIGLRTHPQLRRARSLFFAFRFCFGLFRGTAARMRAFRAPSSISSPSRKSMARRVFPLKLAVERREGVGSAAPLAKVIFTTFL